MLEKYSKISEFYEEPFSYITKVLNSKNIFIKSNYRLIEVIRLPFNKKLIIDLGVSSIESDIFSYYTSLYKGDKSIKSKAIKEFLEYVITQKKAKAFKNVALKAVKNICKKTYKDVEIIETDGAVIVKHPEMIIKNSKGLQHTLLDVYIKFSLEKNAIKAHVTRGKYTYAEIDYEYSHSHYRRFFGGNWILIGNFCLGTNPLKDLLEYGATTLVSLKLLISAVHEVLVWESLEGGPHKYIRDVKENSYDIINTGELVEYDINQVYIQALQYLKDKPGCLYSYNNSIYIDKEYVTQFMRDNGDPKLFGIFIYVDDETFIGELVPKDRIKPPAYNANIPIGGNYREITVVPDNYDSEYVSGKDININILDKLSTIIDNNLKNAVEYIYEPY